MLWFFWIGIFAVVKSIYALIAVCLGAASRILKSKIKETAAAVVVGIGLLVGSNAQAQLPDFEIYGIDTTYVEGICRRTMARDGDCG